MPHEAGGVPGLSAEHWVPESSDEMIARLRHPDRTQLLYQVREILIERVYLRHGITVGPGDIVLDVGANVGVSAVFFAAGCGATVHSFEPVEPIFASLTETIAGLPTCHAHNVGISDRSGTAEISYYPRADAMSGLYADPDLDRALTWQCYVNGGVDDAEADRRLDGLYDPIALTCRLQTLGEAITDQSIDRVDLLKIDVERSELDVLRGLREVDWPKVRQVVAEVHDERGRLAAVVAELSSHGFAVAYEQDALMMGTGLHLVYATRP